jgi:hypothetical protein
MASLTNWVARSEDPAQQAMIYQALKNSPAFMRAAETQMGGLGLNFGPGQEYQWFQFARTNPLAAVTALGASRELYGGNRALAAIAMGPQLGLTAPQALTLQDIAARTPGGDRPEEWIEKVAEEFKRIEKVDLATLLSGKEPLEIQRTLAETANKQLNQAMDLAKEVAMMRAKMVDLVDVAMPALLISSNIANAILGPIAAGIRLILPRSFTDAERAEQEAYAIAATQGNPALNPSTQTGGM